MCRYIAVNHTNRRIRTRTYGGVGGKARKSLPIPISFNEGIPEDEQVEVRQKKYLNNIVEQDHRFIKKRTRPMLGFKNFYSAKETISGI